MRQGKSLMDMCAHIEQLEEQKHDVIADSKVVRMRQAGGNDDKTFEMFSDEGTYKVSGNAHAQLAQKFNLGKRFYDRLADNHPDLLVHNVNELMTREPARMMLRTHKTSLPATPNEGQLRAVLSDKYQRIDNYELMMHSIMPVLSEQEFVDNFQVASCEVTDSRLYLKVIAKGVTAEPIPGDVHHAGFVLTNSEVGLGAVNISEFVYRQICTNGMWGDALMRKAHVGKRITQAENIMFSQNTIRHENKAIVSAVKDMVKTALDAKRFNKTMLKLQGAAEITIDEPHAAIEVLSKKVGLNEKESKGLIGTYFANESRDGNTMFNMVNSITQLANNHESYDRASELEALGHKVLTMPHGQQMQIARAVP